MKTLESIVLIALVAITSAPATANEPLTKAQTCQNIHKLATSIMESRQNGQAMPDLIAITGDNLLFQAFVETAYELPRYSTKEMQQRSIEDFANQIYAECWKQYKSSK